MTLKGWRESTPGGWITEAGNALEYKTGSWRTIAPVYIPENCINCMFCWAFCPDDAIIVEDGKMVGINYDYCKGCGICARECPAKNKALVMGEGEEG
ncbi:MAG: 4Fe-4S binding protein [bacterium]|jgi:pyruvate ferredoxin oxidoreductase delta subunit|nr:4Fe-4S binding protein [Bacillota bacterium]HHW55627.1 4Fe-4S binding protein [Bacillota bacterium]